MVAQILKGLAGEKIVLINPSQAAKLPFTLKGIVRLVDKNGSTISLIIDKKTLDEIEEETEASSPEFLSSLEESRRSGRVSGEEVKKRLGIK